jgi:hypothetical protein
MAGEGIPGIVDQGHDSLQEFLALQLSLKKRAA